MKTLSILSLWLASCILSFGAGAINGVTYSAWNGVEISSWNGSGVSVAGGGGGGGTTLYGPVDMEATGAESGWSTNAGSPNWDATAQFKNGAQSLELSSTSVVKSPTIDNGIVTWKFWFRADTLPGSNVSLLAAYNAGYSQACALQFTTAGLLQLVAGTTCATVDALSADTWYYITVEYSKGTGANGTGSVGFSTDGSSPSSGNKYASFADHNATDNMAHIFFYGAGSTCWFDDIEATAP